MNTDQKTEVAMFRFGVISDLVGKARLKRGEIEELIKLKSSTKWQIPYSDKTRISESTLRRWIRAYENSNGKLESLYPKSRQDKGDSRVIDDETGAALIQLRKEMPIAPINMLIEELKKRHLVAKGVKLYASTVYRFLNQHGILRGTASKVDRRRFEAELPNDIWQSDILHGPKVPHNSKLHKSYLIAFIDDHSRLVPYGQFFLNENLQAFLECFKVALLTRGVPRKLYVDNGSAFRSKHLEHLCASLGIALVHSAPYTPQGRGKIERFFRTVRSQFLSNTVPATLAAFNLSFETWLNERYHQTVHSSTGQAPIKRFSKHVKLLRPAPKELEDHFRKRVRRRVTKDRAVSLDGRLYEAPIALISEQVELLYHLDKPENVEVRFKGKGYGFLTLLDTKVNCRIRREKSQVGADFDPPTSIPSAGRLPLGKGEGGGHE